MIASNEELFVVAARVSKDMQDIQNYLGQNSNDLGVVKFPHGFVRTAAYFRSTLVFINNQTLKANLSYGLILSDVFRWILNRTSIQGTAKEMIIKEGICLFASLTESTTKNFLDGKVSNKLGFKARTKHLHSREIIDEQLKSDLDWLWDTRNNEHVYMVDIREHGHYKVRDYNRALSTFSRLRDQLNSQ